ncbi:hypothetical protein D3C77_734980 [compost metagenome]
MPGAQSISSATGNGQLQFLPHRMQCCCERIDFGCVAKIDNPCHLLLSSAHTAREFGRPDALRDHFVEHVDLGRDTGRKRNQNFVRLRA